MQTVTFYSYKGGTGRSLALANVAKYLARFGQSVFALDLDLEAPGLHYKLYLGEDATGAPPSRGVVDYISDALRSQRPPTSLQPYVTDIECEGSATIHLMAAGAAPTRSYWQVLSRVDWHDLVYGDAPQGIPLFADLKVRIDKEYQPDILLIDARTGITEIGGIATTLLADVVVCLMLRSRETLDGTRAVLRSIIQTPRLPGDPPVRIVPVLSRVPVMADRAVEAKALDDVLTVLNARPPDGSAELAFQDLLVLHVDPGLQVNERLLVDIAASVDESELLADYIRLIAKIFPLETLTPNFEVVLGDILTRALDDPDDAEKSLETLALHTNQPSVLRRLIQFYQLRNKPESMLRAAFTLWRIAGATNPADATVELAAIEAALPPPGYPRPRNSRTYSVDFLEDVWRAAGANSVEAALKIVAYLNTQEDHVRAARLLLELWSNVPIPEVATACLRELRRSEQIEQALEFGIAALSEYPGRADIQAELGRVVTHLGDKDEVERMLQDHLDIATLLRHDPAVAVALLRGAGRESEIDGRVEDAVRGIARHGMSQELADLGRELIETGRRDLFEQLVRRYLDPVEAERVLEYSMSGRYIGGQMRR